jgi:prepilin-type N-terminal cleavage/methylation domain-containing protein
MKKAFSLIELSIVLVIIALIITATIQSGSLISKSRLATARSLTENSVVNDLDGLVAWYETSLESSFGNIDLEEGVNIETWHDRNPKAVNGNHATMSVSANQPILEFNAFNKAIPALHFDGANDHLAFDGKALENSSHTFFIVERRDEIIDSGYMVAIHSDAEVGETLRGNADLLLGYASDQAILFWHIIQGNSQTINFSIPEHDPTTDAPTMHTWTSNNTSGGSYWLNGGDAAQHTDTNIMPAQLSKITNSWIGRKYTNFLSPQNVYYEGYIAEIIIFNRTLKTSERRAIERYLGGKYGIKLND